MIAFFFSTRDTHAQIDVDSVDEKEEKQQKVIVYSRYEKTLKKEDGSIYRSMIFKEEIAF